MSDSTPSSAATIAKSRPDNLKITTPDNEELVHTDFEHGLSSQQVRERQEKGLANDAKHRTSRSVASIITANVLTLFNAILTVAMVVVLVVGSPLDALFAIVMIVNSLTGIVAEVKAKRTLDKVAILDSPTARVIRDGKSQQIDRADVVVGDVTQLKLGDQISTDGYLTHSAGLEVDESILTGESVAVAKSAGDQVLAGTAVVSGNGTYITHAVGHDLYSEKLAAEVKKFSTSHSELREGVDRVLRWISWGIVPVVALLVWSQLHATQGADWHGALVLAVAGVVGMIPQGLVLLTSVNFAVAAATLARRSVLVQELQSVEILARVDLLCTDKTGTLTSGAVHGKEIRLWEENTTHSGLSEDTIRQALAALAALVDDDNNETATAVKGLLDGVNPATVKEAVAFSSARKWSAIITEDGTWVLGAPEIILDACENSTDIREQVNDYANRGERVICLAHSQHVMQGDVLPSEMSPVALAILEEELRPDAAETMRYFTEQGVAVKVISGDNPRTVAALAERAGIGGREGDHVSMLDARDLPSIDDSAAFSAAVAEHNVFGRVTPEQKRAMVGALQREGHTVAMTGDGVNDAMALKDADLGIAMGSGAAATKAAAQLVLLNGDFSALPPVVAEGRRIIANMERVASLFFAKTTYAALIAIMVAILGWSYPFLPRHLTIIGSLTIGIPAFFVALAPNSQRYRPGFLPRTLRLAIPAGIVIAVAALTVYAVNPDGQGSTAATSVVVIAALYLLSLLLRPPRWWQSLLLGCMLAGVVLTVTVPVLRQLVDLQWPTVMTWAWIGGIGALSCLLIEVIGRLHNAHTVTNAAAKN